MSTPILPVLLPTPGNQGLLSQLSSSHLPPQYATTATNCIIDSAGRIGARKGWDALTTSAIGGTPTIYSVFEYIDTTGDKIIVSATSSNLYDDTTTLTARTGALSPTGGHWKFQNFNDKCIGWQAGHSPIVKTGAGNWAAISFDALSGGSHTWGNEVCVAYGRVWTTNSDGTVVKYSSLLDETDFAADDGSASNTVGTTAGVIDTKAVWVNGMDSVVSIAPWNGYIVFFGKRNILIYGDAAGMQIGALDPNSSSFHLVEAIDGRGCVARDSVQAIGEDLFYLSYEGVFSLGRVIQEKSNPQYEETINIRDTLIPYISGETSSLIKSTYNHKDGIYLLTFPTFDSVLCLDVRGRSETGGRKCTFWSGVMPGGVHTAEDGTLYIGDAGVIGYLTGYTDNGSAYQMEYYSGWFPVNEETRYAVLKNIKLYLYTTATLPVTMYWYWDYNTTPYSDINTFDGASGAEYGTAEYGEDEFGSGGSLSPKNYMGKGYGSVMKYGLSASINGSECSVQQLAMYAKAGRI